MEFFATCNGIPVHISDSKKGEKTIVLLHGYLETLYIWDDFIKLLPETLRIVSIDLPGHGLTGSNKDENSIAFMADVVKSVLDLCKIESACVVGHSMGGYVAIEAIKRHRERFSGIVLMHSGPGADTDEKKIDREREIELIRKAKLHMIVKMGIPKMFAKENLRRMDEKIAEIEEISETHDPEGIVATINGLKNRENNLKYLKECNIPLLIFFGTDDYHIPVEKAMNLQKELPEAKCVFLQHSGHNGFLEEPQIVKEELLKFLEL
ncbi:MAG: alpha/beta hydrolase [Bacteroidales bacterium]|nr:alpha/beta hydrolase [Bacteroidales bacterium]